jgi:hypothetical protein
MTKKYIVSFSYTEHYTLEVEAENPVKANRELWEHLDGCGLDGCNLESHEYNAVKVEEKPS